MSVEEAKDFLGFGSEASVSDAEVVRAADMFNDELKSIFGDLEEAWKRLFRVLKPCKCCGGGYGNGRCTGCEWIANRWEPFLVGKAILMAFGVDTAISPSNADSSGTLPLPPADVTGLHTLRVESMQSGRAAEVDGGPGCSAWHRWQHAWSPL